MSKAKIESNATKTNLGIVLKRQGNIDKDSVNSLKKTPCAYKDPLRVVV